MKLIKTLLLSLLLTSVAHADVKATIVTNMGSIELLLNDTIAPETVKNFISYAQSHAYNGTIFHRVIPNFMIQGGGFNPQMQKITTQAPIKNEASKTLSNARGTIAMARTNDPHSATSQFFINHNDNANLNPGAGGWGYAVFGKVTKGMEVVDSIARVKTGNVSFYRDVPLTPIIIEQVVIH